MKIQSNKQTNYSVRVEKLNGVDYVVVPVVMMVEGVHSGSRGPVLHLADELGKYEASWNGIPVTVTHPTDESGNFISANSLQQVPKNIGVIYNTYMDGSKLKAEAWLNKDKLKNQFPTVSAYITQGRHLEVSVGVFSDDEESQGTWNNEEYLAVAKNYRPDHLALLPGEQGACSWDDGCGIRVNHQQEEETSMEGQQLQTLQAISDVIRREGIALTLLNNVSLMGQIDEVRKQLYTQDRDGLYHYLLDVGPDYYVYEQAKQGQETQLWRQMYEYEEGTVSNVGDPQKVKRKVEYLAVNSFVRTNKGGSKMTKCKESRVDALINNQATRFDEADREFLMGLDDNQLAKLEPVTVEPQVNTEQVVAQAQQALKNSLKTPEDFINLLPAEMKDQFQSGLTLHQARRNAMVTTIMTNTADAWTKEELEVMGTPMLEKLAKSVTKVDGDYTLSAGGFNVNTAGTDEVLLPPGVAAQ